MLTVFKHSWNLPVADRPGGRGCLVVRSAPAADLHTALTLISRRWPGIRIDVITSDDLSGRVSSMPHVHRHYGYPSGPLSDLSRQKMVSDQIDKSAGYDSAYYLAGRRPVVIGYDHIRAFIKSLGASRCGVIYNGGFDRIDDLTACRTGIEFIKDILWKMLNEIRPLLILFRS